MSLRGPARFLTICLLVIAVLLGITEGVLRFVFGLGNPVLIAPDSACEYTLKPNQRVHRFFVNTRTNRYGMRSDDVPPSRDPNRLRIMFLGDSLTYGTSRVDQSQIFTEILHRNLPSVVHKPVDVLNASAGAWAPDNEVSYIPVGSSGFCSQRWRRDPTSRDHERSGRRDAVHSPGNRHW